MSARSGEEFRVRWQRQGLERRTKLYQTRKGADEFVALLTGPDPESIDDGMPWQDPIPPIIAGPDLEVREVGDWKPA